jgi:hypothetical protein
MSLVPTGIQTSNRPARSLVPLGRSVNFASNYHVPGDSNLDNKECDSLKSHTPVQKGP